MSRCHPISFQNAGSGTPIVLIPGWTMSAADWLDAGYIDRYATSHRVLAVDPLGNGLSEKPHDPVDYRWPDGARDIMAVLDAAGMDHAVVWGYSRGSWLAAVAAAEFPERVRELILTSDGDMSVDEEAGQTAAPLYGSLLRGEFGPLWDKFGSSDDDRQYDTEVNDPAALGALLGRSSPTRDSLRLSIRRDRARRCPSPPDPDTDLGSHAEGALEGLDQRGDRRLIEAD